MRERGSNRLELDLEYMPSVAQGPAPGRVRADRNDTDGGWSLF